MSRCSPRALCAIVLCAFSLAGLCAEGQRGLLVCFEPDRESSLAQLESALVSYLVSRDAFDFVLQGNDPAAPAEEAARKGCAGAVLVKARSQDAEVVVHWSLSKPSMTPGEGGNLVEEGSFSAIPPVSVLSMGVFWIPLADRVELLFKDFPDPSLARLTVEGTPGAHVTGLGPESVVIPRRGSLEITLNAPADYHWKAKAKGMEPVSGLLSLLVGEASLTVNLRPVRRWAFDFSLRDAAFPEFQASYLLPGDTFFVRADLSQYYLGLHLADESNGGTASLFSSFGLLEPGIGGGVVFGNKGKAFRPNLGVLISLRLSTGELVGFRVDDLAPVVAQPFVGLEWRQSPLVYFFFEMGPSIYLFTDGYLLSSTSDSGGMLRKPFDTALIEFPRFRIGLRFRP